MSDAADQAGAAEPLPPPDAGASGPPPSDTTGAGGTAPDDIRAMLTQVVDPEIPVVTIEELGILRDVTVTDGAAVVTLTPTYSGCPAMDLIRDEIRRVLAAHGIERVELRTVYGPAWTTDWITPAGRVKLESFGIAPPHAAGSSVRPPVACPRCRTAPTRTVSEFGSTACKALMVCESCGEPFDYFKEL